MKKTINGSRVIIFAILILSVLLRLPNLNKSLWYDELWSTNIKLSPDRLLETIRLDTSPPFHSIFMFFWINLFGDSEISIRIPPLIFGILSIFLTYLISLRYMERKRALLVSFLLCISPVHIWYSQEARLYSGTLFFLLLSIFSYQKLKEIDVRRIWYFVYFISIFLVTFSHYCMWIYLAVITLLCFMEVKENDKKQFILASNIMIMLCFCFFTVFHSIYPVFLKGSRANLRPFTLFELWMLFFNWFLFGNSIWNIYPHGDNLEKLLNRPEMFYAQIFFFIIFMRGLILNFKESKDTHKFDILLYLFSIPLLLLGLPLIGIKKAYIERGAFFILPFFYIILSKGTSEYKNKVISNTATIAVVVVSFIAFFGYLEKRDEWTVYKPNPDWRSVADYFDSEMKNSPGPIFILASTPADALNYYLEKKKIHPPQVMINHKKKNNINAALSAGDIKIFYCIKNKYWSKGFSTLLENVMEDLRFSFINSKPFKGIEIYKFRVRSQSAILTQND